MLYIAYAVLWLLRFALGACVFSFLGVVVWRLPRRESVVKGRSHCQVCGRTLSAAELIPCLSYLLQGGKCRGCGRDTDRSFQQIFSARKHSLPHRRLPPQID